MGRICMGRISRTLVSRFVASYQHDHGLASEIVNVGADGVRWIGFMYGWCCGCRGSVYVTSCMLNTARVKWQGSQAGFD